jgi:hypothetical protein
MLENAILGLGKLGPDCGLSKIVVISTESHFLGVNIDYLKSQLERSSGLDVEFHFLDSATSSVVETLTRYLETLNKDISVVIKDSDNLVSLDLNLFLEHQNVLAYADLVDFPKVSAPSKSYLEVGSAGVVSNFIEKRVISSLFSVGVTKFARISDLLDASHSLRSSQGELYVSDLVRSMMGNGIDFQASRVQHYQDWGTLDSWLEFVRSYKTIFLNIDGVLALNSSRLSMSYDWTAFKPIDENVAYLLELEKSGRVKLVFTTARSEEFREVVSTQLMELGFLPPLLVMGLFHSQRLIINDFSSTNPNPSAVAVSLERDSSNLREYIGGFF